MNLTGILNKHFTRDQKSALKQLLSAYELYQPLSDISEGVYAYQPDDDREESKRHFGEQTEAFVSLVSLWLIEQEGDTNAGKNRDTLGCLLVCMATEALQHYQLKPHEVHSLVQKLVLTDAYLMAYHMEAFYIFIGKVQERWLELSVSKEKTAANHAPCKEVYFIWQVFANDKDRQISQEFFLKDLYHLWHRKICLSQLRQLFDSGGKPFTIEVASIYLKEFMAVFYLMHECKRIVCKNSKGIFVYMKNHLKPPLGDTYPQCHDFSKMLYKEIHHPINGKTLRKKIKSLLDKYGTASLSE